MTSSHAKEAHVESPSKSSLNGSASSTVEPSLAEKTEADVAPSAQRRPSDVVEEKDNAVTDIEATDAVEEPVYEENEEDYPKSWKLGLISVALCLSVFCMALDNTIIATAIPRITDQFKALDSVGWFGSAYLLTTCSFQLIFGKLYTFYSIKWTYLAALFIFEIGSLICGVAPNATALIVGRAVAGLGCAGIFSGAILIVAHTVPLRQRPTYTGMIGAMYGIASVAGPLMGGAFTDRLTWRWCFYINLPFGAVTALFIIIFFQSPKRKKATPITFREQLRQMDLLGNFFFLPGIISLLLALQWGGSKYEWKSGRIIGLFVVFAILIIAFIAVQIWKQEKATVPPRIIKNRNIWGSAVFAACTGGAFFVFCFYLPIWFQAIKGASAVKSGIMNLPMILGLVVISVIAGGSVSALGYYTPFMYISVVLMSIGAGLLTTLKVNAGHSKWIGYQFVFGAGVGFGMQQPLIAAQTVVALPDVPIATAIMMFSQTLGGSLIISVAQNVFSNQLIKNLARVVPDLPSDIVLKTGATELKHQVPAKFLAGVLSAYNEALSQTFYVGVALSVVGVVGVVAIQWISVKGKKIEVVAG
ncbi:MFS general substrate transporter [Trichodelitschia bisporula]|uniref:MFS general substrate transporter n=1 Tax=Trichodelitschia bisporula TaxID=703511 RepID=A0A6G1IBE0_9PEZI|nr:MFS general substrate transporter [Trichodelitschia bisporula]